MKACRKKKIYIACAPEDECMHGPLVNHLAPMKRAGRIATIRARCVPAGESRNEATWRYMARADLILLLVSADFFASEHCASVELRKALALHRMGHTRVIPVIVRPCDWRDTPLGRLQATPRDGKPVSTWRNRDEAFLNVVETLKVVLRRR